MGEVLDVRDSILSAGANLMVPANLDKQVCGSDMTHGQGVYNGLGGVRLRHILCSHG